MNPMIDQALDYVDWFDWLNGLLVHLDRGSIKKKGLNITLDGQDGLKTGLKFEIKYSEFYGNRNQSVVGSD